MSPTMKHFLCLGLAPRRSALQGLLEPRALSQARLGSQGCGRYFLDLLFSASVCLGMGFAMPSFGTRTSRWPRLLLSAGRLCPTAWCLHYYSAQCSLALCIADRCCIQCSLSSNHLRPILARAAWLQSSGRLVLSCRSTHPQRLRYACVNVHSRSMRLLQSQVPLMDSGRLALRSEMSSLQYYMDLPLMFLMLNPAPSPSFTFRL